MGGVSGCSDDCNGGVSAREREVREEDILLAFHPHDASASPRNQARCARGILTCFLLYHFTYSTFGQYNQKMATGGRVSGCRHDHIGLVPVEKYNLWNCYGTKNQTQAHMRGSKVLLPTMLVGWYPKIKCLPQSTY